MNKHVLGFALSFLCLFLNGVAVAQTVTEEDVEESNRRKTIAENEKAIADAKKGKFDALFPKPDVSSLVGGTKINEGPFMESQILGYCAMKVSAKEIATRINTLGNKGNIVVYNEADVKLLARYRLMMNRLKNIERGYNDQSTQLLAAIQAIDSAFVIPNIATVQATITNASKQNAAGLIIDTALKFLSLFKTDIEITPSEIEMGEKELIAELFGSLDSGFSLYYPQTIPLGIQNCSAVSLQACSPLLNQIMVTSEAHDNVAFLTLRASEILDDLKSNERSTANIQVLLQQIVVLDAAIAAPATTKADKAAKREEKKAKLLEINGLNAGIAVRNAKYTTPGGLVAFRNTYGVHASKIEILNKTFKLTMEELGFSKEPDEDESTTPKPAPAAGTGACTGKDCTPVSSQTTNVNVNVGENSEEGSGGGGGGGGDKTFASYLQAESLHNVISAANSRWLDVKMVKAGGNMRVKSNIFTNLVVGSRVNFSGGSVVSFNVFDNQGKSEKSGVVSSYNGYQKSSNIIEACESGKAIK